jgi:hypothetical protein
MMTRSECERAETLAGAIAIGEALESERGEYRAHLAACPRCLEAFGGEREIERVMSVSARARDDERWEPDLRKALVRRRAPGRAWGWAAAAAAVAITIGSAFALQKPRTVAERPHVVSAREASAVASLGTQSAARREGRAESLVVESATPVTAALRLNVDRRGTALHCTITKSSGDAALDAAVCRAALHQGYAQTRGH